MPRSFARALICWGAVAGCGSSSLEAGPPADASVGSDTAAIPADAAPGVDRSDPVSDGPAPKLDTGPPDSAGGSFFVFKWGVQFTGSPQRYSCEATGLTEVVISIFDPNGRMVTDRFPCAAMKGTSRALVPGTYDVELHIDDARGIRMSESRGPRDLLPGPVTDLDDVGFEVQSFLLEWTLQRGGKPTTCAAANATTVELVDQVGNTPPLTHRLPCADGKGFTRAVVQGNHTLQARVIGANGMALSQTPPMVFDVPDDKRAALPAIVFDLGP
jgi:hypothetical protein